MSANRYALLPLLEHSYWATGKVLAAAAALDEVQWRRPGEPGEPGIRGTLVHCLDVERSWRLRLGGAPADVWTQELAAEAFPTFDLLRRAWADDEREMREWFTGLTDGDLDQVIDLGGRDRFPLGSFLLHVVLHSAQQRSEAALLLTRIGHSPADLDFLNYLDWSAERPAGEQAFGEGPQPTDR